MFQLRTTVERTWLIEASTNLIEWLLIGGGQYADGLLEFADPGSTNFPQRFYRAVAILPP